MKRFLLSDNSVNSHGFRLDMSRIKLDRFKANPVMLYNHYDLIGRWDDIKLEDGKLTAVPVFMEDMDEKLAETVKKRVEKGFLKGASLGIRILSVEQKSDEPPVVVAEVMEASIVDIPANANALALYDETGKKLEGEAYTLALGQITEPVKTIDMKVNLSAETLTKLGLSGEPDVQAIERAIEMLAAERDNLQKELQELNAQRIEELLNAAVADGRLNASLKEKYRKLAEKDFDLFAETLQSLPKASKLPGAQPVPQTDPLLSGREEWTFNDWRKKDPAGLLRIKHENPELYNQILNR